MTQAADWQARVGDVWAEEWRRTDRALADLARRLDAAVLAAAPPGPFRALDIGSGAGATAIALAKARSDADVTGIDLSPALVAIATERSVALPNCRFEVGDVPERAAAVRPDLLVSRHGVMFFADPVRAFIDLRRAAAPGARLVFTCFAEVAANPWATLAVEPPVRSDSYMPGPFAFGSADLVRDIFRAAGWSRPEVRRVDFAYRVGAGEDPVGDAVAFLSRIGPAASALRDAAPADRPALLTRLRDGLVQHRRGDVIDVPAAAWLWSARKAGEPA